jgi:hypothetical protein
MTDRTTREDLVQSLARLKEAADNRVQIVLVIVGPDGKPTGEEIYGGSFVSKTWGREDTNGANEEPS